MHPVSTPAHARPRAGAPARESALGRRALLAAPTTIALLLLLGAALLHALAAPAPAAAQGIDTGYPLRLTHLTRIYVDPRQGKDTNRGTRKAPLCTISAAWNRIPKHRTLQTGYRILLKPGTYSAKNMPNSWEDRHGTDAAPIIIQAMSGMDTVQLANMNVFNVGHLALVDLRLVSANDVFHCERCDNLLLRHVVLEGVGNWRVDQGPHETFTANQSSNVYIEASDIGGAGDNAVDMVAVQHARIYRTTIHDAQDWCMYAKGGSIDVIVDASTFHTCGTGGFTAGQGTGLEFMTVPFLQYEAYDVAVVNSEFHDLDGAAFGVNGGWNILLAHNTAYRVGTRSHAIEVSYGSRRCDGDAKACSARTAAGAWGPPSPSAAPDGVPIPNHDVLVYDNLIVNPAGVQSAYQQLEVSGPRDVPAGLGVATTVHADDGLQVKGNTVINGGMTLPLGVGGDGQGCQADNPTCSPVEVALDNAWGNINAALMDPDHELYGPAGGVWRQQTEAFAPPPFDVSGLPAGHDPNSWFADRSNDVSHDRYGAERAGNTGLPGAAETQQVATLAVRHRGGGNVAYTDTRHATCYLTECTSTVELWSWHRLVASPSKGWRFEAWTGDCHSRTSRVCWVYSNKQRAVTARFAKVKRKRH